MMMRRIKPLRKSVAVLFPVGVVPCRNRTRPHEVQRLVRFQSTNANVTLGIMRETYGYWERRVPLTPNHVKNLLLSASTATKDSLSPPPPNLRVLIQPCEKRIFGNQSYEDAGAYIQEDLADANIILAVKRPKEVSVLLPNKTYLFFAHVIKGQKQNMDVLRACLEKNIQLIDYEKILGSNGKRLVSFSRFAGLAGAIDALHGLGRRLHQEELWTPFTVLPQTIYYGEGLEHAKDNIRKIADAMVCSKKPFQEPMVVAVTGRGGAVYEGVMEILQLLPYEIITIDQLHQLFQPVPTITQGNNKIFICPLGVQDVFERCDGSPFDRSDFSNNPHAYRSTFKERVAPYAHVVVNCAYWDDRFPRIMTKSEAEELFRSGHDRLRMLSDISCDVHGSFEFLEKTTTIDKPFFQYDPLTGKVTDVVSAQGITVNGVDILPSQLPRESSQHFGDKLFPVICKLATSYSDDESRRGVQVDELPDGVRNACITTAVGTLESKYRYLDQFLKGNKIPLTEKPQFTMILRMQGHLFDSGLINHVVDAIVDRGRCHLAIEEATFPTRVSTNIMSSITLRISSYDSRQVLDQVENDIKLQMEKLKDQAEATISREDVAGLNNPAKNPASLQAKEVPMRETVKVENMDLRKILVLGSGYVAKAAVRYLDKHVVPAAIQVASNQEMEAREVASAAKVSSSVAFDILSERKRFSDLVEQADIVLSLVPAHMHVHVANECLRHNKNLVTSSYASKDMQALGESAKQKGLIFLNEVGLDPGLDHMSAVKIIDDIKKRGGDITRFSSVCGGLPSPECVDAANKLRYKFSWSPGGVLRASKQDACYRYNGQVVEIKGKDLLGQATPFLEAWPELDLDVLPNRNSLSYEKIYGLESADTIFRGTLRYRGFAPLMQFFSNVGLMSSDPVAKDSWNQVMMDLAEKNGFSDLWEFYHVCASGNATLAGKALVFMNHLEITGTRRPMGGTIEDAFCKALEKKISYGPGEHDMVLMHHDIGATFGDGAKEVHKSTLKLFGDEEGSAMAKTVGFTAGAAVTLLLDSGELSKGSAGVLLPTHPWIYLPILSKVADSGIRFVEDVYRQPPAAIKPQ